MGAAGDMLMSALYELLPDKAGFLDTMNRLNLPGVSLMPLPVKTCGIAGTRIEVTIGGQTENEETLCSCTADPGHGHGPLRLRAVGHSHVHTHEHEHQQEHGHGHGHEHQHEHEHGHKHEHEHGHEHAHHHATPGQIAGMIDMLPLPEEVRTHARAVYDAIACAEAKAHGCAVSDVHFHEVGALDAVADVVGVCYAIHLLSPDLIAASPVHVGSGSVRCAHGVVPVPAPATAILLEGVPAYGGELAGELCTPTGAALLSHFVSSFGPMPPMAAEGVGYGIGKKEFPRANCVRAFFGTDSAQGGDVITELVCNLDDMSGEALSFACGRLLELGALDVYTTPGVMKKGRPGHVLTVLCSPMDEERLARAVLRETSTNGLRRRTCGKYFMSARIEHADTSVGSVRIKYADGWGSSHVKPEYEDIAAAARKTGLPFSVVWEKVLSELN